MNHSPKKNRSGFSRLRDDRSKSPIKNWEISEQLHELNLRYASLDAKLESIALLTEKVKSLEDSLAVMQQEKFEDKKKIAFLEKRLNRQEQYTRKDSFEIREVPMIKNESITHIVSKVAEKLDISLDPKDISVAHRLKTKEGKIPGIIVKLCNRTKRDEFVRKRKPVYKSDVVEGSHHGRVYISDSLSPYYKELLWKAKQIAQEKNYKYVWWRGEVCVRKAEKCPMIKITSEEDLQFIN